MADEIENHTRPMLQEMRHEMREMRDDLSGRLDDLTNRVDGNTLILNMLAGMLHDHEGRITRLEARK